MIERARVAMASVSASIMYEPPHGSATWAHGVRESEREREACKHTKEHRETKQSARA
jgi:hypothetical protein